VSQFRCRDSGARKMARAAPIVRKCFDNFANCGILYKIETFERRWSSV
jgi:hypothetical protein